MVVFTASSKGALHNIKMTSSKKQYRGIFFTDFDGTLFRSDGTISDTDISTLEKLGEYGIARVIATGRSLHSYFRTVTEKLPIDYLIFSTGTGVLDYSDYSVIKSFHMGPDDIQKTAALFMEQNLDFMIHAPVPDNHRFAYWPPCSSNPDYNSRISLYKNHSSPLDASIKDFSSASQLLAILPENTGSSVYEFVRASLPRLTVIRTTSPLDGSSVWIEVFPRGVSKGHAAEWLTGQLGISYTHTAAIGNDYNDLELLHWAGRGYAVYNAPPELKNSFFTVSSNNTNGVTEAAAKWLDEVFLLELN